MITAYEAHEGQLAEIDAAGEKLSTAVWLDLFTPTRAEERRVEELAGLDLPTRADMEEIELSSRLYASDGAVFMTATIPARADGDDPDMQPVSFVLLPDRLVTVRYHHPHPFRVMPARAEKGAVACTGSEDILLTLLEAVVDREADILERSGREIDDLSRAVFKNSGAAPGKGTGFREILEAIGRKGDLVSKIRDSLATLDRLAGYFNLIAAERKLDRVLRDRTKTLARDIRSIAEHAGFLAGKITFLLDATLGLINIEQSNIIKIFSVVAFVMLPPTLIASVYGMNFDYMPELGWRFGYPAALGLMVLSAVLPYLYFKRRGWLR
ncbi:MAG: magnesium transporter [Alphaproteobacteria bacterium]|jgi:magnesium transporter|nr:magnesium transporter [Alphaproteobacteria bacterium]